MKVSWDYYSQQKEKLKHVPNHHPNNLPADYGSFYVALQQIMELVGIKWQTPSAAASGEWLTHTKLLMLEHR